MKMNLVLLSQGIGSLDSPKEPSNSVFKVVEAITDMTENTVLNIECDCFMLACGCDILTVETSTLSEIPHHKNLPHLPE